MRIVCTLSDMLFLWLMTEHVATELKDEYDVSRWHFQRLNEIQIIFLNFLEYLDGFFKKWSGFSQLGLSIVLKSFSFLLLCASFSFILSHNFSISLSCFFLNGKICHSCSKNFLCFLKLGLHLCNISFDLINS